MIIAPRRPTRERLRFLANHRGSMLRALEEEIITSLQFHGRLLDVGGGASSAYNRLLPKYVDVQSLNINPSTRPSVVAYADRAFPFGDKAFDAVISFNTLEHVYGAGVCLEEMVRVLRPGGAIHMLVPFLFPIHGRYRDYHRHTAQYWDRRCGELGLEVFVEPLTWGAFSAAQALLERLKGGRRLRRLALEVALWQCRHAPQSFRLDGQIGHDYATCALGYYVAGRRPAEPGR